MRLSKRILLGLILLLSFPLGLFSQWSVTGGLYTPYTYTPESATGLSAVVVLYGTTNLSLSYRCDSQAPVQCYRYSQTALQAESVSFQQQAESVRIENPEPGYGYFIEQEGRALSYIWLIDYQPLLLKIEQFAVDPELTDCEQVRLYFDHRAPQLVYYSIHGRTYTIDRTFTISWETLSWDDENKTYQRVPLQETVKDSKDIPLTAPLCDTGFQLVGDQFLQYWGIAESVTSQLYQAKAVDCQAFAEQQVRDAGNELDKESGELGGSAPVNVSFTGYANYPVVTYQAWEISRDANFEILEATYTDQNLEYSFENEGTTYVRFVVSNSDGTCEKIGGPFTINTSESSLEVPNVFTPDSESGNNQIFKVAYKSIIKFEGRVFNRWGNLLFHWTDPSQGWDGKYHGKVVPTGAYFYVIKAQGVGGKKYNLKGDINVLRTRN